MHVSVLLDEVITGLGIQQDGVYVDATGGVGGHAEAIANRLSDAGRLYVFDCDAEAISQLGARFRTDKRVIVQQARFSELFDILRDGGEIPINGLIADLGISSVQLDDPERGIGLQQMGPLDMRLDQRRPLTAAQVVNSYPEAELIRVFRELGEERYARKMARAIVHDRQKKLFATTQEFAGLAERVLGFAYRRQRLHPARRVFQGLRIEVNQELGELAALLAGLPDVIGPDGKVAVISFHSLEDRLVKRGFKGLAQQGWKIVTKKPITPGADEQQLNPRSRSAKLRLIER